MISSSPSGFMKVCCLGIFLSLMCQILLVLLEFGCHNISGGFPELLTKVKGLKELYLSSNMFEGIVPEV